MKLTEKALTKISEPKVRLSLAIGMGFTERWIQKLIDKNAQNGPLTTMAALKVIRKETGLKDSEILEEATQAQEAA